MGGTVNQVPDSGPLALNTATAGAINPAGQLDEWTFFERAGRSVTVLVDPGSGAASGPRVAAAWLGASAAAGPSGNVLATADNTATGSGTIVTLNGVLLPTDGTYKIQVQAPTGHTAATGNYVVTAWDATPNEFPLNLDQTVTGGIVSAASVDHWNFSAVAGQQVQFHLVSAAPGIAFRLTGPGGFVGFDNLQGDSPLVTLSASGNYVLTAYGLGGQTGNYAFCLWQTSQTDLALDTPYNGTLAGSGQAQLFRVNVPAGKFLHVTLNDSTSTDSNEVYLKFGLPPTRSDFDYRYSAVGSANQDVWALNSTAGTWYVLVYGAAVPAASNYTLTATAEDVAVTSFSPNHTGTITNTVITLTGAGFGASTTVSLVAADGTAYPAAAIQAVSSTTLSATFNAGSVPAGVYSLSVSKAGGTPYVLPNAFTVVQGGLPHLVTKHNRAQSHWLSHRLHDLRHVQQHGRCRHAGAVAGADRHAERASRGLADPGCLQTGFGLLDLRHAGRIQPLGPVPGQRLDPRTSPAGRIGYGAGVLRRLGARPVDWSRPPIIFSVGVLDSYNTQTIDWTLAQGQPPPGFPEPDGLERDLSQPDRAIGVHLGRLRAEVGRRRPVPRRHRRERHRHQPVVRLRGPAGQRLQPAWPALPAPPTPRLPRPAYR